jgi:uncharacterized protein
MKTSARHSALCMLLLLGIMRPLLAKAGESPGRLVPVDPAKVKVDGEIGRRIDITVSNNLLGLDLEQDFLRPFREKKGAPEGYVGLGKLIDATVSFAYYGRDKRVIALKDHLIKEITATQLDDGYIGVFPPSQRITTLWDLHEMVYLIHALVDNWRRFNDKPSLEAARKLGDYIMQHRKNTAPPRDTAKLNTERAFIALTQATGDSKYLNYAVDGMDLRNWSAPVAGHAYTFMNLCLAQLDLYQMEQVPDKRLLRQSHRVIEYLTRNDGLIVSGTCSLGEGFHNNQDGRGELGETCATAYLVRLLHYLLQIEGNSLYGDMMERSIYNALFAAESPEGRQLRYFTCLEGSRRYYRRVGYCCPGNFRRIMAELPEMVYYRTDDGIAVDLYTTSQSQIMLKQGDLVKIEQQTDYPNSGKVRLTVEPIKAQEFTLRLRIPRWCNAARVTVNGQPQAVATKGGRFYPIRRKWEKGDRIDLTMPMNVRFVKGRKMQAGKVAILRGPMLYCFNPARNPQVQLASTNAGTSKQGTNAKVVLAPVVDIESVEEPVTDSSVRPDGMAIKVKAWSGKRDQQQTPDLTLLLTEFADPGGVLTYLPAIGDVCED